MKLQETELTENAIQLTQDELLITKDEARMINQKHKSK